MKLKLHGNSIRLRLTRSEVARFAQFGRLEEEFQYGPAPAQAFVYGVESSDACAIGVRVTQSGIFVVLPSAVAREWTESESVSVSAEVVHPRGSRFSVLIEKEFRRMHGAQMDPDLYPNPLEGVPAT